MTLNDEINALADKLEEAIRGLSDLKWGQMDLTHWRNVMTIEVDEVAASLRALASPRLAAPEWSDAQKEVLTRLANDYPGTPIGTWKDKPHRCDCDWMPGELHAEDCRPESRYPGGLDS